MIFYKPEIGDTRVKTTFCFLPRTINNVTYWLELIDIRQIYEERRTLQFIAEGVEEVSHFEWVDKEVVGDH